MLCIRTWGATVKTKVSVILNSSKHDTEASQFYYDSQFHLFWCFVRDFGDCFSKNKSRISCDNRSSNLRIHVAEAEAQMLLWNLTE